MAKELGKGNVFERSAGWLRNLHLGIGGIALVGAFAAPVYEAFLFNLAVFESAHAALWEGIRRVAKKRSAKLATA